jgi:hypothetical protein
VSGNEQMELFGISDVNVSGKGIQISQGFLAEAAVEVGPVQFAHGGEVSWPLNGKHAGKNMKPN